MRKNPKEMRRKPLEELTVNNNFMFAAVMMDERIAKAVVERVLSVSIRKVKIFIEKSIIYNPEYKGVRLDVEIEDENHTHYDVEMQVANRKILKRARYYHDQIDMEILLSGEEYENLPDTYVIFICDFDPLGLGKYKYTLRQTLQEDMGYDYIDGRHTVFLSTKGKNEEEVPAELVKFLKFVGASLEESQKDYDDELVRRLQESVEKVKRDREMGRRYMTLEDLKKDEFWLGKTEGKAEGRAEGKVEDILELLADLAPVSPNLRKRIASVKDTKILNELLKKAARSETMEAFESYLTQNNL